MSKIFGEWGTSALAGNFLLYTFSCAFGISCILALAKKESFGAKEFLYGAMIGVPNFFASRFILRALEELPVVIVYPTRGVMCIVLITLAGVLFFSERLKKHQWQAMGLILLSVALLNL